MSPFGTGFAPAMSKADLFRESVRLRGQESCHEREAPGRDDDNWPVLAASLALACPIWTEDQDFFGTGASVWTTRSNGDISKGPG